MDGLRLSIEYPEIFHVAGEGAWESILDHGLLCARDLVEEFLGDQASGRSVLSGIRKSSIPLTSRAGYRATVRDQLPLNRTKLERCLTDMTVDEWLDALNSHVFFWVRRERLLQLLRAGAYRTQRHTVLTLDTRRTVQRYESQIRLTSINTGSTLFQARPRGSQTFLPIKEFDFQARWKTAGRDAVVELAVAGSMQIDLELVKAVEIYDGEAKIASLHP